MGAGASVNAETLLTDEACEALYTIRPMLREITNKEELLARVHEDLVLAKDARDFMPKGFHLEKSSKGHGVVEGVISKVGHICRVVKDSEVAKKFYTNIIGAKLLNRPKFPTNGYWLWLGNTQLHLIESELAMAPDHPQGGTRVNHISFDCYDFDAVEARIKEAGIKYNKVFVPLGNGSGINQIFVQDPDSHWIELCDCHRFNDFIFGPYDEKRGEELRKAYLEGVEPKGTFMATLLFILMSHSDEGAAHSPLKDMFDTFAGADGDSNTISEDDLQLILGRLMGKQELQESDKAQIKAMLKRLDSSADGVVTFDEFHKYLTEELLNSDVEALMDSMFVALDVDGSGTITAKEFTRDFKNLVPSMKEEDIGAIFASIDQNRDSVITRDEFTVLFQKFREAVLLPPVKEN